MYRPRRSVLYIPGHNRRAVDKARQLPADAVILDLEDAVAPAAKEEARAHVAETVFSSGFGHRELTVRVNGLDTEWGAADLEAVAQLPVDAVVLPKVRSAASVHDAEAKLVRAGMPEDTALWLMIETPDAIFELNAICGASRRTAALVLGTSDLARDLRTPATADRLGLLTPLSLAVTAGRAHGLDVIDGVHLDLDDEAGLQRACAQGRDLGFDGKSLIHPRQIATANQVFAPSTAAVAAARAVVEAWDAAEQAGEALAVVDGRLVEHLHAAEARRILEIADTLNRDQADTL